MNLPKQPWDPETVETIIRMTGGRGSSAPRQSLTRQTILNELQTHSRRSDCIAQQDAGTGPAGFFGLLMAHFAVRGLMHEAALKADEDPDRLSFVHSDPVIGSTDFLAELRHNHYCLWADTVCGPSRA